jgi:general secretion pathway protein N
MKLIKKLLLLLLILIVIGVLLLAFLPARIALDFVGGRLGPLQLGEVSGSLWRGQASPASINGEPVGTLGWSLSPLSLLSARIDADLTLAGDVYNGQGAVSVRRDRSVSVRALDLRFPAGRLQPILDIPALVFRGEVQVTVESAEIRSGFPSAVKGRAVWKQAAVAGSAEALFGDIITDFASSADGGIAGTVSDGGGPLQATGTYSASIAGYQADVSLRARDGNPQVIEALQYIGQPQPDGSARLEVRGRLLDAF